MGCFSNLSTTELTQSAPNQASSQSLQMSATMGTPQLRWRETHQSGLNSIMLAMRSSPQVGIQRTWLWMAARVFARRSLASMEMNHWVVARKITGSLQRQQCG